MLLKKPKFWDQTSNSLLSLTLLPISWLVLFFNKLKKLKKKIKFSTKVICVGNIYIGGTGKTPLAIEICKILLKINKKPAFIKKNYKYVSDEIKLLGKTARVFTDKNRSISIKNSIKEGYNTVILDDGFQDTKIFKDFSFVCFNSTQLIGNGNIIPSGPLRDSLSSIKEADCVFFNGEKNQQFENILLKYNSKLDFIYYKYKPILDERITKKNIIAFAGIGNPKNFFSLLKNENLNIKEFVEYPDHYNFNKKELLFLKNKAKNDDCILLTTVKDFMRLDDNDKENIFQLKVFVEFNNESKLKKMLEKIYENH